MGWEWGVFCAKKPKSLDLLYKADPQGFSVFPMINEKYSGNITGTIATFSLFFSENVLNPKT